MGSSLSLYVSNRYNNEYFMEVSFLDSDSSLTSDFKQLENDCKHTLYYSHSYNLLDNNSTLYYYSVYYKHVSEFLKLAEKYFNLVTKVNVLGNKELLPDVTKHFDDKLLNFVDDNFVLLLKRLKLVSKLVNFSFSTPPDLKVYNEKDYVTKLHKNLDEDFLLVYLDLGVTYYLVPNNDEPVKFLGHSPISVNTTLTLFNLYVNNFENYVENFSNYKNLDLDLLVDLSEKGDNSKCDILVCDIYGGGYDFVKLPSNLPASRFGKLQTPDMNSLFKKRKNDENYLNDKVVKPEDFSSSLIMLLVETVCQHSNLHCRINNLKRVLFVGSVFMNPKLCLLINNKLTLYNNELNCLFSGVGSLQALVSSLTFS